MFHIQGGTRSGSGAAVAERRFPAAMDFLSDSLAWIVSGGRKAGLREDQLLRVELACEEVLTNVIRYAYPDGPGKIRIQTKQLDRGFEVQISDNGVPFDPLQWKLPDTDAAIDKRKVGGLGILMVRKMTDELAYSRGDKWNVLVLRWHNIQQKEGDSE